MRAANFSWSGSIYLRVDELELDMHNCFDFRRMTYDVVERSLTLEWARGSGDWISDALPSAVKLIVTGVSTLKVHPRDQGLPYLEDECLSSFGYRNDEHWTEGQFWTERTPEPEWRWSFEFQSGAEIEVAGEVATAEISL